MKTPFYRIPIYLYIYSVTQREERVREKNVECPIQKSSGSVSTSAATERRKTKKNLFCVSMQTDLTLG